MWRIAVVALLVLACPAARAVDGCKALLCFAYPGDPRSLPACVATVEEVLSQLARGGSFPHCALVATPSAPHSPPPAPCAPADGIAGITTAAGLRGSAACSSAPP